jgi:hypothetical protein
MSDDPISAASTELQRILFALSTVTQQCIAARTARQSNSLALTRQRLSVAARQQQNDPHIGRLTPARPATR